jgi:hypothetical protein
MAAPLAGATLNCSVVALAKVYAVVETLLIVTLTSLSLRYGKVKE